MELWNTYQQRLQAAQHVRVRLVSVAAITAPSGVLEGSVALESAAPLAVDLAFRLVRETAGTAPGEFGVNAMTVATAHYFSARVLQPGEVTLVEFSLPYNLGPAWPLARRLEKSLAAKELAFEGETFYLEVAVDMPIPNAAAGDRVPVALAAA